jgi:hypothetical protein
MTTLSEVDAFLRAFKAKMDVFTVIFLDRDKNNQALLELEIMPRTRARILQGLTAENYYRGPTKDHNSGPDLWEFGAVFKETEVYIKITMGAMNKPVICISFHCAERSIAYRFKK